MADTPTDVNSNSDPENENLETLNLDNEHELELQERQKQEDEEQQQILKSPLTISETILEVSKTLSRQDINPHSVVPIDVDFFSKLSNLLDMKNDGIDTDFWYRIDEFVTHRLQHILSYSMKYSPHVYERLCTEERELYSKLNEAVEGYRKRIEKILSVSDERKE